MYRCVCVYTHVSIYVCNIYVYIYIYIHCVYKDTCIVICLPIYKYINTCTYVYMCIYIYILHVFIHINIHIYTYTHCLHMCVCNTIYIYIYIHNYVCISISLSLYIYIYIYIVCFKSTSSTFRAVDIRQLREDMLQTSAPAARRQRARVAARCLWGRMRAGPALHCSGWRPLVPSALPQVRPSPTSSPSSVGAAARRTRLHVACAGGRRVSRRSMVAHLNCTEVNQSQMSSGMACQTPPAPRPPHESMISCSSPDSVCHRWAASRASKCLKTRDARRRGWREGAAGQGVCTGVTRGSMASAPNSVRAWSVLHPEAR